MYLLFFLFAVSAGINFCAYYFTFNPDLWWVCLFAILTLPLTFVLLYLVYLGVLLVWGMMLNIKKERKKPNRFYYWLVHQTDFVLMRVLHIKIIVIGKEKLPKRHTRFVVVNNHISNFDQMVMIATLPQPLYCVSKPENFHFPIAGPFIHHAGFIPVDRAHMTKGIEAIDQAVSYIKNKKGNIAISPEGTRNKTEQLLLPFHAGSFRIALDAKCPLVIVCLKGTKLVHTRAPFKRTRVIVKILETLPYEKIADKKPAELAQYSYNLILEELQKEAIF